MTRDKDTIATTPFAGQPQRAWRKPSVVRMAAGTAEVGLRLITADGQFTHS